MSFRNRLTLFFVLIVIVPMIAVGGVLFRLISDNETGKADAGVSQGQTTAMRLEKQAQLQANTAAAAIGRDQALANALSSGNDARIQRRLSQLVAGGPADRALLTQNGRPRADAGDKTAIMPAARNLQNPKGKSFGRLEVSTTTARDYAARVKAGTALDNVVWAKTTQLATTIPALDPSKLPAPNHVGDVEVAGTTYRARTFSASGFPGQAVRVAVLLPRSAVSSNVNRGRAIVAGVLLGFFVLALTFYLAISRSLQRQIEEFLRAARRLGSGDFSVEVPTLGHDEFAALGEEFNKMSRQLEQRLSELRQERVRLQEAMRRTGETFASNLDRDALLEIVVRTAVDGVEAEAGRVSVREAEHEPLRPVATQGTSDGLDRAMDAAEAQVLAGGRPSQVTIDGVGALAHPLRADEMPHEVSGVVSVARHGRPFTETERDLFHYLAGQAAVSIENVDLHRTVERQAVTDELTGLSNRRKFEETMQAEVERSRRFGQPVGLVMLDIDDFKLVNDTYGHTQGDVVLRHVARILRNSSREVDEPARYGGEELAVVLPGTDLEGAYYVAERVRTEIEALELPLDEGPGTLRITASFGVATLPGSAFDMGSLVEAADDALYRAKRAGKNRTVRAE